MISNVADLVKRKTITKLNINKPKDYIDAAKETLGNLQPENLPSQSVLNTILFYYAKEIISNYTKTIEPLEDDYKELKDKCVDVLYPDVSVNNKCEAFVIGYEKAINSYVSDIKKYNENIKDYNDILEENDTKIEEVKLTIDYIDVDGDRKYLGKN